MISKYHTFTETLIKSRKQIIMDQYKGGQIEDARTSEKILADLKKELTNLEEMGGF